MAKSSYFTQADALLRKNLTFQKRNKRSNCCLVVFPILVCVILAVLQKVIDNALDKPRFRCGCNPLNQTDCGLQYSDSNQAVFCAIPHPPQWPGLLQIPAPEYRAVRTDVMPFSDLPDQSCRKTGSCPVTILTTGNNQSLAQSLGENILITSALDLSTLLANQSNYILGSASQPGSSVILETAVSSGMPLYYVQSQCTSNSSISVPFTISNVTLKLELECAQGRLLWRNSSSEINEELYKGYNKGNSKNEINEFVTAYDFLNSNEKTFNASIWHNATYSNDTGFNQFGPIAMTRVARSVNLASNAYLRFLKGLGTKIPFDFVQEMPRQQNNLKIDVSSLLSADLFTYVIIALFPVVLTFLVYENQNKLRIMMKMHGLGDGPYWLISYSYFLAISTVYVFFFVIFGSLIGLKIFTTNDYSIQFVFFFIYINLQISFAFLLAPFFKNIMTARVVGYILIFGSGLLGGFLFIVFVDDKSFPRVWIIVMELFPGFALYRGLYELGQYSFLGNRVGTHGMQWGNLSDSVNGMKEVLIIMFIEWLIVLPIAYYVDRAISSGRGVKNLALACLPNFMKKSSQLIPKPSLRRSRTKDSKELVQMEKPDVTQERERVEQLLQEGSVNEAVICNDLRKVYPGRDGNPPKVAVKGLSLALPRGECFGMLGPNGAGKTSFIGMMIGLSKPSSGRALVDGKDILTQMEEIYTSIGVCPQHDLLWETLTGREHLMFYGRLKNLKGEALMQAVDESLKSVNLFYGGVGDKFAGKYSGGMKRRLSVAISLIGDPKVVYMDEPSTGLDPASRNNLWNVVKRAKRDRAIVLTTHSMEEAEVLCDRLGIFVDGSLQCIGNPKELKARYGGSFVFTMTTSSTHETDVESMVRSLSPSAQRVYHISGTQKFELPKQEVRISDVFRAVQRVKSRFTVYAWGLADTTLEDVFIKVARDANAFNSLS